MNLYMKVFPSSHSMKLETVSFSHTGAAALLARHHLNMKPFPLVVRSITSVTPLVARSISSVTPVKAFTHAASILESNDLVSKLQWRADIDFNWINDSKEVVALNIKRRNSRVNLELVLELYEEYLNLQKEVEQIHAERNAVANKLKGKLELSKRQMLIEEGKNLEEGILTLEEDMLKVTHQLQQEAKLIPNMTHPNVPTGGEDTAVLMKMVGSPREFGFPIKVHLQIERDLDRFDFVAAAKVSGSKFYILKDEAALLETSLINWTLSEVEKKGFTRLSPPQIVKLSLVEKCGYQPRGSNTQVYSIKGSEQCMIGTAEIPMAGFHMDSILSESELPLKYVAYSRCFRKEAGSAGKAGRGLYRVHQFSKVEMFILCRPEDSESYHDELVKIQEELFSALGLHYKILDMGTLDLGASAYRKFDIEAWMPGLNRFGEISSASNCTDYQSRRLGIRFRPEMASSEKKNVKGNDELTRFVHTLNATACAVPRMMICLLENYQQADGSVVIPEPLRPFMGGLQVISPKSISK